jgi:hypothetical protein
LREAGKSKKARREQIARCVNSGRISPTSNKCIQLYKDLTFSSPKIIEPYQLELTAFLRLNKDLWNKYTIEEMIQTSPVVLSPAPAATDDDQEEEL